MTSWFRATEQICHAWTDIARVVRLVSSELLFILFLVFGKVILHFGNLGFLVSNCLEASKWEGRTSPNIAYQCASDAKIVLLLSIFITPIDFATCSTSLSSSPSTSSLMDSGALRSTGLSELPLMLPLIAA